MITKINENEPLAFITKNKQRVKQYPNNVVYLKNQDEYEIEIFNPKKNNILCKITIDGNNVTSNGIIVKPGQRVFLERFVETPNKFKFITYDVDGDSEVVKEAISNNGKIKIEFYDSWVTTTFTVSNPLWYYDSTAAPSYYNTTNNVHGNYSNTTSFDLDPSNFLSDSPGMNPRYKEKSISETGRTEKGNYSNQNFDSSYENFNFFPFQTINWKILPESNKVYTPNEINTVYCVNCGAKRRKTSHKFCPICGTKYE